MTTRLFVALWPSPEAVAALEPLVEAVAGQGQPGSARLHWQVPDRWHITLAFLGPREVGPTVRRLDDVAFPAVGTLALAGAGTFGPILWAGVDHGPGLSVAARNVQAALDARDVRFRAHVTLARARGSGGPALARDAADQLDVHHGPCWAPADLTLVASTTGPAARYEVVHRWPLPPT